VLPGFFWNAAHWPGCILMVVVVLLVMALLVWRFWADRKVGVST
jgi:hypothetical protein